MLSAVVSSMLSLLQCHACCLCCRVMHAVSPVVSCMLMLTSLLQSSISEGLPISILEAGMSGLCVVCTDVGGCAETMSDGRRSFGRLTSARNHKMVAYGQMEVMAMLPTLSNPNLSQPPQVNPDALMSRLTDPAIHEQRRMWGVEYKEFIKRKFSLFTHASQQRQAFYLTHYSRQICAGDTMPGTLSLTGAPKL